MFKIGDKITHPMHGAGVIEDITVSGSGKQKKSFYVTNMVCGHMTVLIPCDNCEMIGVRKILTEKQANAAIKKFADITFVFDDNWNRRYRENVEKIKTGDMDLVSEVVKSLYMRDREKNLSTGERKLFINAKNILVSELMLSTGKTSEEIENELFGVLV